MERPTFEQTVQKLVTAYLNDELEHASFSKCVVGNLCGSDIWKYLFYTSTEHRQTHLAIDNTDLRACGVETEFQLINKAINVCEETGYTVIELRLMEYRFETAPKGKSNDDYMFNGLMAVVDVLAEIHGVDLFAKANAKLLFV